MTFGINGPDNLPSIQPSHQTNDGGAGNLGYFKRQKEKQKEEKEQNDSFESSEKKENGDELLLDELDSIGTKIKNFWLSINIIKKLKQKNPEDK